MKLIIKCVFLLLMAATTVYGRQGRPAQRIHAAKVAYITDRLRLTEEQSARFMPVFREYEKDRVALRMPYLKKYKLEANEEGEDRMAARQYLEADLDYQQDVIALKRRYNERFASVLDPKQVADVYVAEREFRLILLQRLKQRREGGMRGR
ncbi:MAG: hypothetical protein JNM41_15555 [Flavipsychrobacter sp.]|nr:hypothetical protein [Flavipsychrobacter sp.]